MKGMSFGEGTGYKSPQMMKKEAAMKMKKEAAMKMKKEAAMKMKKNSPMDKPLVGDQHKLPEHLKQKIEAAPTKLKKGSPNKAVGARSVAGGVKKAQRELLLKENPPGSAGRKAAYDRLGFKYDDTVPGYNRDGTKKSDTKTSTMTDPKKTDITGSDKNVNTKDYTTASTKGRKTTVVKTKGDKTAALVDTKRNIGNKRVINVTGPKGDIREKTKFDTAGEQTKKKRKITLPDGTVIKVKSKKGGKRKVKVRKKGRLFGKRDRAREARLNEDLSMQPKN